MAGYERKVKEALKDSGWEFDRQAKGSHEIWDDGENTVSVPTKIKSRHTANAILKAAGIKIKIP